jgi:uncharacterized protein YkwD
MAMTTKQKTAARTRAARGAHARTVPAAPRPFSMSAEAKAASRALEKPVVALFNEQRATHGLAPLKADAALREVAALHSADMLAHGYFAHDDAHGSWSERIQRQVARRDVGEILSYGSGEYATPAGLVKAWMQSAEHRRVILTPELRRVGLGVATGTYEGATGVSLVTADFATAT